MQAQCTPSQALIRQAQADKRTTYCTLTSLRNSTPAHYHPSTHCVWHTALHIAASNALAHRAPDLKLSAGPTLVDTLTLARGDNCSRGSSYTAIAYPRQRGTATHAACRWCMLQHCQPTNQLTDVLMDALKSALHSITHLSSKTPAQKSWVQPAAPTLTNRDSACSLLA